MNIREQIVRAFQKSAPGVCIDTPKGFAAKESLEWNIEALPSGGTVGVVLAPKSHSKWRLFGVAVIDGETSEAINFAKQCCQGRDVYAYDPGPCDYQTILSQLPVEIRSIPCEA